jgi:hypothetical protein
MREWIKEFVASYREETFRLSDEEIEAFDEYAKEQLLRRPCQIEIVQLNNPYRLILLFLFDKTKKDLQIALTSLNWKNLNIFIVCLLNKYSQLKLDPREMSKILLSTCNIAPKNMNYSIDFTKNVCCLSFTRDVRMEALPIQYGLRTDSGPESIAKTIFHLNHGQAQDLS